MTEAQASQVAGRPVTQEDIWLMHRVGNPAASPDGRWLAVAVIEPAYDPAEQVTALWVISADGAADGKTPPRCLARGPAPLLSLIHI